MTNFMGPKLISSNSSTEINHLLFFLFLMVMINCGCSETTTNPSGLKPPNPSVIKPTNPNYETTRFPGTKAFAEMPSGYEWDPKNGFYTFGEKENNLRSTYFPVNYEEMKRGWQSELARNSELKMRTKKVAGKEVMIMEGYLNKEKTQMYMLMMETNYHPLMLFARIVDTTLISKMDVPSIIESLRHDDDFDLDIFAMEDFEFDENISGFKYYFTTGQKRRTDYLRNRIADMENLDPERISVYTREKNSEEEIKEQMKVVKVNNLEGATDYNERMTVINGMKTNILEVDYNIEGKLSYLLYARIRGPEKDFVFRAKTNRDIKEMKDKFSRTLESFKVK